MKLSQPQADLFIPDKLEEGAALARVTHLCVGAHQDDIEFMAFAPIRDCYRQKDKWFAGVTTTDGAGSPRAGLYASTSDADMVALRRQEQRDAAQVGAYAAQFQLNHPSSRTKKPDAAIEADFKAILLATRPSEVFTHNLADKHDSHVGVALRLIAAIRSLPAGQRPQKLTGCEVWRSLDWLNDEDKVVMNQDGHENLADALMGVYDSQIEGGKRYDLGTRGRRRANATYFASHGVDRAQGLAWDMDLTPLIQDDSLDAAAYVQRFIDRLSADVAARLKTLG
jgi:LmbE family N-acetylglucosaminyl deacetylase